MKHTDVVKRFIREHKLSRRESEALGLIARGLNVKEVADCMRCGEKNVYAHLSRACHKVQCSDYHVLIARLFQFACESMDELPPRQGAIGA